MTVELFLYLLGVLGLALAAAGISRWVHFGWAGLALLAFTALILPALQT